MRRVGPFGSADGTPFEQGTGNDDGSFIPAAFFTIIREELAHLVEYGGMTLSADDSDLQQVRKAITAMIAANTIPDATTALKGKVELATVAEAVAGLLSNVAVTPDGLAAALSIAGLTATTSAADNDLMAIALAGGGHRKITVANLFTGRANFDQVARDQIALTNLRQLLNTSVATSTLVQGKQWELATDEWGAASTNETYTAGSPAYYGNGSNSYTQIAQGTGTNIGDMTSGGGLAALYDGNTSQPSGTGANNPTATGNGGKDYTAQGGKAVGQCKVYASSDYGFYQNTGSVTTVYLEYADTSGGTWTTLASNTGTDNNNAVITVTYNGTPPTKNCWRARTVAPNGACKVSEIQFFTKDIPVNSTLMPPAAISLSAAPDYAAAFFLWKDDSGTAVLGIDLTVDLSRDGTTWVPATLTILLGSAGFDGTYTMVKARAGFAGQPIGTVLTCRIKTLNTKAQRVAAPALYAE